MPSLVASIRLIVVTLAICVAGYTAAILAVASAVAPDTAEGSLLVANGRIVGSRLIAQKFTQSRYFWPRPSAVDYNAAAAGGSNKSPTSSDLIDRAKQLIARYGATTDHPLPAELAAASGSGLDPDLTELAALYQVRRVAHARSLPPAQLESLVRRHAFTPGGPFTPDRLVNVLELNLALDAAAPAPSPNAGPGSSRFATPPASSGLHPP